MTACAEQHALVPEERFQWLEEQAHDAAGDKPVAKPEKKKKAKKAKRARVVDVVRDEQGAPVLPLLVGPHTVHALGVLDARPAYHTTRLLLPVGYRAESARVSYKHPDAKVVYSFEVCDGGDAPLLRVTCAHDSANAITGASLEEVMQEVTCVV